MAETTPNLGLKKPLESEFVSIHTLNENMDVIDQSLGSVNDLPTQAKNAVGAISEVYDHLSEKPPQPITLTSGVQIVQGGDVPAILHPTIKGRTLVNLLGRDGNCEDLSKWAKTGGTSATTALDSNNKVYGNNSIKFTWNGTTQVWTALSQNITSLINPSNYYIALGDVKNGNATWVKIGFLKNGNITYYDTMNISDSSRFNLSYARVGPNELSDMTSMDLFLVINVSGSGQFANFDGIRLYEVSQADYDAIPTMSRKQVAAKYPYVDEMKHVNAVYIENKGKNLLPPFSEWTLNANAVTTDNYSFLLNSTGTSQSSPRDVDVVPGETYTFNLETNGQVSIYGLDDDGALIQPAYKSTDSPLPFTLVVPEEVKRVRIYPTSGSLGVGTFSFTNPMLNLGPESLLFEPQKPSYLYLPDCNLRSNIDGSIADRLYTDGQGKPRVTRRFREVVLDGSMDWAFETDHAGYKRVRASSIKRQVDSDATNAISIKYDGKILQLNSSAPTMGDQVSFLGSGSYISIADTDSGWGESYTPTADEIKAYFNGWRMYSVPNYTKYTSGTKYWAKIYTGTGTPNTSSDGSIPIVWGSGTTVLPTEINNDPTFTPYRLMYQLAQSVDEPVTYEGSLMLHEGDNQVEVGTGGVVREAANPIFYSTTNDYLINNISFISSLLSKRTNSILALYKNGIWDRAGLTKTLGAWNGNEGVRIPSANYDPTAAYSVTYLALDSYTLGIAPQKISAEYAPNIRESVESLVRELVEARTETSVLQNTKAQKQQPQWIEGTLINEFAGAVRYTQSDNGFVTLQFTVTISNTTLNTLICRLPKDYLPYASVVASPTVNNNTGSTGAGVAISRVLGGLVISGTPHFNVGQVVVGQITYRKHMGE
ncbi:hypothetical protein [Cohnella hongkongensis]|uniref:Uncharacterized protein n=1 Tax=Cohnella hongkongensis TaxID=178337 RepID=A0ABV9FHG2_9BACL